MNIRKPSIKEVAALAGVSTATVSNVYSGRKPVNDELRKSVQRAAESLGYQVDRAASQLRSGRTRIIAVLVPDLTDTFFATIVSNFENKAFEEGYDVIVASSRNERSVESSRLNALLSWRPAGLIVVPCTDIIPAELIAIKDTLPMVLVDRVAAKNAIADTVTIDNRDAGEVAARHLLEMGHEDIVLAVSHLSFPPIGERADGAAAIIAGYTGQQPKIIELGSDVEGGRKIFAGWLERNPIPGAVIAVTNVTTLSVLAALADHHIDIPSRTSIVAFDDYAWMAARKTGLTAIRQPTDEIVSAVWKRLCYRMEAGNKTPVEPSVFSAGLVVRNSVKSLSVTKTKTAKGRDDYKPEIVAPTRDKIASKAH